MGYFTEYLNMGIVNNFDLLSQERKKQLKEFQKIRGNNRDIMVYASDLTKNSPNDINYDDKLAFYDQIPNSKNTAIDVIIETPGGFAEVVEDLVRNLREKYSDIAVIVPGYAKSAGTIFAMAADDILMGSISALGPIDAQIITNGKVYSAGAFLDGLENIRAEIEAKQALELAYIPILQNISPGEIEHCEKSQEFSQKLVRDWLCKYKFKNWNIHNSNGKVVTEEEKSQIANDIAEKLAENSEWKTHGKSLNVTDLENLGLRITDFSKNDKLNDAIMRYYTLMRMSFEGGAIYKIFETPDTQIYKMLPINVQLAPPTPPNVENILIDVDCPKCKSHYQVVAPFGKILEENKGCIPFPQNNILFCKKCHEKIDLSQARNDIERQFNKKIEINE